MGSEPLPTFLVPGTNYGYTGAMPDTLGSRENTLISLLLDESDSTRPFGKLMEEMIRQVVKDLKETDQANQMLYRQIHFSTDYREYNGFKEVPLLNPDDYIGCYHSKGRTILYDAYDRVLTETVDYAKQHATRKYIVNGVIICISDGCDYGSLLGKEDVRQRLIWANAQEELESLKVIQLGVNDDKQVQKALKEFSDFCGFAQYQAVTSFDKKAFNDICDFVVRSSVATSQALGTGGPSQNLTF